MADLALVERGSVINGGTEMRDWHDGEAHGLERDEQNKQCWMVSEGLCLMSSWLGLQ